jgi:hypothetical protein
MNGGAPAANYVINIYATAWTDATLARNAVRFERKLELSGEGHRFFDLVRWGVAATTLNAYLAYERTKVSASPFLGASFEAARPIYADTTSGNGHIKRTNSKSRILRN